MLSQTARRAPLTSRFHLHVLAEAGSTPAPGSFRSNRWSRTDRIPPVRRHASVRGGASVGAGNLRKNREKAGKKTKQKKSVTEVETVGSHEKRVGFGPRCEVSGLCGGVSVCSCKHGLSGARLIWAPQATPRYVCLNRPSLQRSLQQKKSISGHDLSFYFLILRGCRNLFFLSFFFKSNLPDSMSPAVALHCQELDSEKLGSRF